MLVQDRLESAWTLRYGANLLNDGVEFRVWAPQVTELAVRMVGQDARTVPLESGSDGEFRGIISGIGPGADYFFVLDGERERPDPVSRWQPRGVHGPSRVVDPSAFKWNDNAWNGIALSDYVIYELHIGTLTPEGTFAAAIAKIPYLRDLGITAIEILPVAAFPGARNWGYDGVDLYAAQDSYGGPTGLKQLIDACHGAGLAVVLDVVYNHVGPEGNYLREFAPYFTSAYRTPWGEAINFDGPESDGVRRFFIDNSLYWLTEYHVDALRLDAVHGIYDFSARHILQELTDTFHRQADLLGRSAWVIAESDLDDVRVIHSPSRGGHGIDAQWNDDFHHSLHTALTGTNRGYLMDFGKLEDLGKAIREGFVFDGRYSQYRRRHYGSSSKDRPGEQFVVFIQNHDQIANTCQGKRLASLMSIEQQKLAAALVVLSPFLPLLFMGQEYGETAPFLYFTNFGDPQLCEAVKEGRRKEFAALGSDSDFADPENPETFERSKLNWASVEEPAHASMLQFYRDLVALRKKYPSLSNCRKDLTECAVDEDARWLVMKRSDPSGERAVLMCNFSSRRQVIKCQLERKTWKVAMCSPPCSSTEEHGGNRRARLNLGGTFGAERALERVNGFLELDALGFEVLVAPVHHNDEGGAGRGRPLCIEN